LLFFRCRFAIPISRCRSHTHYTVAVAYLFAVYGCNNGTEFSYVTFTEQQNFTTAERRNGNGMMETGHYTAEISALPAG